MEDNAPERRRAPRRTKALDYARERRTAAEYPHWFRRAWPRTKATASRAYRRTQAQELREATGNVDLESADEAQSHVLEVRRERVRKWGDPTLGVHVAWALEKRTLRTAWNFFKREYTSPVHREPFARFLAALTEGRSGQAVALAELFSQLLAAAPRPGPRTPGSRFPPRWDDPDRRAWLSAFFEDEPEWEPRLRRWVADTLAESDGASRGLR